jgi:hypothetical protein
MKSLIPLLTLGALLATPAMLQAKPIIRTVEKTFTVQPGGNFKAATQGGDITIRTADVTEVRIIAKQVMKASTEAEADEILSKLTLTLEQTGNDVKVSVRLFNVRTRTWLFPATWLALIARAHRRVGIALAEAWRLPALVVASVREAESYDTDDGTKPANAVRFANALAKTAGVYAGEFDPADVADQVFTGRKLFALSEKETAGLVDGLRARVEERMA